MNPHFETMPVLSAAEEREIVGRFRTCRQRSPRGAFRPAETAFCGGGASNPVGESAPLKLSKVMILTVVATLPMRLARAQSPCTAQERDGDMVEVPAPATVPNAPVSQASFPTDRGYAPPSHQMLFRIYMFDGMGPYPIMGAFGSAAFNQASNSPPEWGQGFQGYTERFLSNYGFSLSRTTSRYLLARALREDTLYYPCDCTSVMPRVGHAVLSSFTARSGPDGHRVFSFAGVAATYSGTMVGVYGWYPRRYGIKDVARMGSYATVASVGLNISYEFLYSGRRAVLARRRKAKDAPGPNTPIQGSTQ